MSYLKKLQQSADRKIEMRRLRKKGMTHAEIAKVMKVSPQRVQQVLSEMKKP